MTPTERGPYELVHQLGEGGMGTVWLARHRHSSELVAVKLLTEQDARIRMRFRREIKILQQLDHPGVVPLVHAGDEQDGTLWYAMKLIKGEPLSAHLRRLNQRWPTPRHVEDESTIDAPLHWTSRLSQVDQLLSRPTPPTAAAHTPRLRQGASRRSLIQALATTLTDLSSPTAPLRQHDELERAPRPWPDEALAQQLATLSQLCGTLAYVHGEGIVHCDLKPENIVITERGDAILVDFGIADRFGARVEHEALEGAGVQAGTAYYISPEQIRGEPVDARTDLYALGCILYEILTGAPPFTQGASIALLLKHLSTTPAPPSRFSPQLPASLDMLCARLLEKSPAHRIGHARAIAHTLSALGIPSPRYPRSGPTPKPYLYRPTLTGREPILAALDEALLASRHGEAQAMTLGGESGVGKSSVAADLIARARNRGFLAMSAPCHPIEGAHGEELLAGAPLHAFAPLVRQILESCADQGEDPLRRALERCAPYLAPYLEELDAPTLFKDTPLKENLSPDLARQRLFHALYDLLSTYAGATPLLLLFDDVHGADELSLEAILSLARRARQERSSWMLLTSYASDEQPRRLVPLLRHTDWHHLRLERLDAEQSAALCAQMLGVAQAEPALVHHIHLQSQGNPFFVAESLRLALEQGQMQMDELGRWRLTDLATIEELSLPDSIQALIAGRLQRLPDLPRQIAEVASVFGQEVLLDGLCALMERTPAQLSAGLDLLVQREILLDRLTRRYGFSHERMQEVAYARIEEQRRRALHAHAARWLQSRHAPDALIAHHHERALEHALARQAYLRGARQATLRHAFGQAKDLYSRALHLTHDVKQALDVRHVLVEEVLLPARAFDEAQAQLELMLKEARRLDLAHLRAEALTLLASASLQRGDLPRAERLLDEASARFEALASGKGQAETRYHLATLRSLQFDWSAARELAEQSLELYRRLEDRAGQARTTLLLGELCWRLNRQREAESRFEQARTFTQRLGLPDGEAEALTWLAQLATEQGRTRRAQEMLREAYRLFKRMDHPSGLAQIAIVRARIARAQDDATRREEHLLHALSLLERTEDPHHHVIALCELAELYLASASPERAAPLIDQAHALRHAPLAKLWLDRLARAI